MKSLAGYGLLGGIALLAVPSTLAAHPSEYAVQRVAPYERGSSPHLAGQRAPDTEFAQVSQSPGPGPVVPGGGPYVNVDPSVNAQTYKPPPNTNFGSQPGCSGDIAGANQTMQLSYQRFIQAQSTGQPPATVQEEYNKYMQARALWDCLQAKRSDPLDERKRQQ